MRNYLFSTILVLWFLFLSFWGCSGIAGSVTGATIQPAAVDESSYAYPSIEMPRDAAASPGIIIKAAPNTVKIKRDADVSTFATSVNIRGARNEHEPFQIIPIPSSGSLKGVLVGVSDLSGPSGTVFSRENFSYYLEGYIYCSASSDFSGDTGWFPDPLIPITDPFDISQSTELQPVWVDCYIPPGTMPGVYTGNVIVTASGGLMKSIPIKLKVLNLTLGEGPRLKTAFGLNREIINSYHGFNPGDYNPAIEAVWTKYADLLLDRGIGFWGFDWFKPSYRINADNTVTVDFTMIASKFDKYLGGDYDMTAFHFPLRSWDILSGPMTKDVTVGDPIWRKRVTSYIQGCAEYIESKGLLDRSYMFVIDEPRSATDYNNVRYIGGLIQEITPRPKFLVTEQAYSSNFNEWGSLLGYVDIFCPFIKLIEPYNSVDPKDPYNKGGYNYETWVYTNTNVAPFPGYAIDHPALEPRLVPWLCYQYNIKGILYWSVNYWKLSNPWADPYTLGDPVYGSGNGSMMYPGMFISQYAGQQNIDGPISSIRLEQIREGLEDYEYLMAIGGGKQIPELGMVVTDYDEFITDGVLFYTLRNIGTEYFFGGK